MAILQPTQSSVNLLADESPAPGPQVMEESAAASISAETLMDHVEEREGEDEAMTDVSQPESEGPDQEETMMNEAGPSHKGKRVKVYELRDSSWFDRGTGLCQGAYDDSQDIALIVVEAEELQLEKPAGEEGGAAEGPGGFLKDELLLSAKVEKDDIYARQQDTLIVWTEPTTQLDIALSFQDAEGCEDIWQFICDVQRHLNNLPSENDQPQIPSSSSPLSGSPMPGVGSTQMEPRSTWQAPSLANIKDQEMWLRMQGKSPPGRERAVEHILGEDYIKQLIGVFDQAEDLESVEDLHALCSLMQTILLFNDNGIFEYILQDEIFLGVIGMLEYDPDFPSLKASYRQFFQDTAKFRQVVEIKDPNIRSKIHQTYRLLYLKDVVLARVLDDPTFGILNGFVFFNQVDIINHIQNNEAFLIELFTGFKDAFPEADAAEPLDEWKRDIVMFLHQLMIMGKGVQVPSRLALYRNLMERGLLFVCEWAFLRPEAQLLHAGAEILTLAVEHDVNAVRMHVLKEEEAKRRTLIIEIIGMLGSTKNLGLLSQMSDILRTLMDTGTEGEAPGQRKESPISDSFIAYFYDKCVGQLYKPLLDAPEVKASMAAKLSRERTALFQSLTELLSFAIGNQAQNHRASFFILSNPISRKIVSLLYIKDKPLRHAALRFVRACLRTPNHFIHRYFTKNDLLSPLLDLLEEESARDNMLSSACMDVLDLIRKENIKPIINYLFENFRPRLDALSTRPFLRGFLQGLTTRWEQNNEPPPAPPAAEAESSKWANRAAEVEEEEYFNASDEEEIGPKPPVKRKRVVTYGGGHTKKRSGGALGLDYDDGSDSEGSNGGQSPRIPMGPRKEDAPPTPGTASEELEGDLGDVAMRMRAKRLREEEEEEGFAGMMAGKAAATTPKKEKETEKEKENVGGGGKREGTPIKEKKIRLNFGALGKKLGGGGGR